MKKRHICLAITGASGVVYGLRLAEELLRTGHPLTLLISRSGFTVLKEECGLKWAGTAPQVKGALQAYFGERVRKEFTLAYFDENDLAAPIASGSSAPDAMVVAPCSMGSLGRIAAGLSGTLIERSADVMLKEGRQLLLLPRETPFSAIHLENMLKLARLGVRIIPAMPAFYHGPQTLDDLVNFVVGKVLDQLGVEHRLYKRWEGQERR